LRAGDVLIRAAVIGLAGPLLSAAERALFAALPPAGVILFGRNIVDPKQLATLIRDIRAVVPGFLLLLDQEGGRVARLRPPHWRAHPSAGQIGLLHADDRVAGLRVAWLTGALIGLDCAALGFDVICAPVLDLRLRGCSDVVGDRSFGEDPVIIGALGRAMAEGVLAAGLQPVMKHMPGHGRALADSHLELPVVHDDIVADLLPFRANADLPWGMTAHVLYPKLDEAHPATVSSAIIRAVIRGSIGFAGILVSDDLAMGALSGPPDMRARTALLAGCDLAMYCSGEITASEAVLRACPVLSEPAVARLAAASMMAQQKRQSLDAMVLADERAALLR